MKKLKINISGMHCASCASNVEKSLKKVQGIKEINVNLMMNKAYVDAEDNINQEEIKKAIENAGFKLVSIN